MDQGSLVVDVTVQYFKYPNDLHWRHELVMLGEDEHGVWLGGPIGSTVQRGGEPVKKWPVPFVQLVSPEKWWTLIYNGEGAHKYRIYVDIITEPCWVSDSRVEMIDIDLDVVLNMDGLVRVLDGDEFEDHLVRLQYPPSLVDGARIATAEVAHKLEAGQEPFAQAGAAWLTQVL